VVYVGDRVRKPAQLNGKSSNLNHVILNHIYPDVQHSNEVSWKDVIVVMDCDHLVEPPYFQKCCSVLLNKDVAVCLVPQAFHNLIRPDFFDNRNANFMFRLMPYYFGAGCCFITGALLQLCSAHSCHLCPCGPVSMAWSLTNAGASNQVCRTSYTWHSAVRGCLSVLQAPT
jgi:hypothetical protein